MEVGETVSLFWKRLKRMSWKWKMELFDTEGKFRHCPSRSRSRPLVDLPMCLEGEGGGRKKAKNVGE